jgi:aldose 1-epimerase
MTDLLNMNSIITYKDWGFHQDKDVFLFKLKNASGAVVELTNYGAGIVSVMVPDKHNKQGHVVLGFDDLQAYLDDTCYVGSSIGRFANRIANAEFQLADKQYFVDANEAGNSNHSGSSGYHSKVFDFSITGNNILFTLFSPDGEGGYPGNLELHINYELTENNQLKIQYLAVCDKETIANFTNHAYFNLSGGQENILGHQLTINADELLETNDQFIPTGNIILTGKKAFCSNEITDKLNDNPTGFNKYYILNKNSDNEPDISQPAAVLDHETSGRRLNIYTTYPGLLFYSGDHLQSTHPGKASKLYQAHDGLCLECQLYPDAPNHPSFPPAVLKPGEYYDHKIIYEFTLIPDASIKNL